MRKDAQARRERLIAAAADLFEEHGYGVALEQIAERARVGRGTLYRNFHDRDAMIVAVLERRLDELTALIHASANDPGLFEKFMGRRGVIAAFHAKALVGVQEGFLNRSIASLRGRADALLQTVLDCSIASGSIPAHVTTTDMQLIHRMVVAAATTPGIDHTQALNRALSLLLAGLRCEDTTGDRAQTRDCFP